MDEVTLQVSDIIIADNACYRVIYLCEDMCVLCQMECSNLELVCLSVQEILAGLNNGNLSKETQKNKKVIDVDTLSSKEREKFNLKREFIRAVSREYAPTYLRLIGHEKKNALVAIIEKCGISRCSAWRYIRLFLQSGLDENSLLSKSTGTSTGAPYNYTEKTGRPQDGIQTGIVIDEQTQKYFYEALEHYKSGRVQTLKSAYDRMNLNHYMRAEFNANGQLVQQLLAASERPTLRQFQYFVNKELSAEEKDRIKTSVQEQRNNKRLLLSDNLKNVMGPGDCIEMDEVEVDISLVSQINPDQTVGRPVVYAMIDVYTRAIIAVSVSFDNNSVVGLTNCLMNLAEDKVALCSQYGLSITPKVWPSGFIPRTIRADRGSEYRSKEAKRIFNELNINLELVPGGSGSLKGSVEQWFHQMHSAQNPLLEGKGLIQKRYDSKHHQDAVLTIDAFKRMLYAFVIAHNQTYMQKYPLTRDMIAQKVQPTPCDLWCYGVSTYGNLRPIANQHQFFYTLLSPVVAKISRKGIIFKDLYYMDFADFSLRQSMYKQGNKSVPLDVRIDPRDVGYLYMLDKEGKLKQIPLNAARTGNNYQGISLAEYEEIRKAKREQDKIGTIKNEELRVNLLGTNALTIAAAENAAPRLPNTKNIRESRSLEKRIEANKLSVSRLLEVGETPVTAEQNSGSRMLDDKNRTELRIIDNIDDAFALFYEGDDG